MQQKSELPEGWAYSILDNIGKWSTGGTPSRKVVEYFGGDIPWVKSGDLNDGIVTDTDEKITKKGLDNSSAKLLPAGTFSVALYGATIGKLGILNIDAATNQACANCQINPQMLNPMFLFYYLLSQREELIKAGQGGAQPNLTNGIVRNWPITLPPFAEQHRIVSAIEALFARLDAANEKLDRVPEISKKFRESVLAAACDGRLTEAWREEKEQSLEYIDFLNNLIENFGAYVPSDYDPIIPQSIPEEWKMSRCYNLCDNDRAVTYGVIKLGPPVEDGIPTLRSSDVRWLKIDKNHVKCISPEIASNYSRTFLKGGEILVTVRGTLGGVAVVPQDMAGFNISREVAVIPLINGLNSHFFSYAIASKWSQNWLSEMTKGVAYTGINIKDLKNLPLSVPPIQEQNEIVRRVDALFACADSIEAKVKTAREKSEKLRQSILAKAFSGELVETEAEIARREGRDYETAEVLLERIKEEKVKSGKKR